MIKKETFSANTLKIHWVVGKKRERTATLTLIVFFLSVFMWVISIQAAYIALIKIMLIFVCVNFLSLILVQCIGKPKPVANSRLTCTSNACQISCLEEHKFSNGETTMQYFCNNMGQWMLKSLDYNEPPPCDRNFSPKMHFSNFMSNKFSPSLAVCMPKCLNNGICISPGEVSENLSYDHISWTQ